MYISEIKKNTSHKNPVLLDYWLTTKMKNELNLKKETNPEKKYNKINLYSKSKIKSNKNN
jgi:hypothetical protein